MAISKTATKTTAKKTAAPAKAAKAPAPKTGKAVAAKPAAPKKTAGAPAQTAKAPKRTRPAVPTEQRRNYVEVAAYFIAERHGFTPGRELADWAAAEAEIDRLLAEGLLNP